MPRYYHDGTFDRAKVYISSVGNRQCEDAGSAIVGHKIDVYIGNGKPVNPFSWDMTNQTVVYLGNNLY